MSPYRFERPARSRAGWIALAVALALWLGLGLISAHWLIIVGFALPPALMGWDLWHNPVGRVELTDTALIYDSGKDGQTVPFAEISKVRLLRRLDFSWVVQLMLEDGRKLRLPPNCTPPIAAFEDALRARGLTTERIQFSLTG